LFGRTLDSRFKNPHPSASLFRRDKQRRAISDRLRNAAIKRLIAAGLRLACSSAAILRSR